MQGAAQRQHRGVAGRLLQGRGWHTHHPERHTARCPLAGALQKRPEGAWPPHACMAPMPLHLWSRSAAPQSARCERCARCGRSLTAGGAPQTRQRRGRSCRRGSRARMRPCLAAGAAAGGVVSPQRPMPLPDTAPQQGGAKMTAIELQLDCNRHFCLLRLAGCLPALPPVGGRRHGLAAGRAWRWQGRPGSTRRSRRRRARHALQQRHGAASCSRLLHVRPNLPCRPVRNCPPG